MQARVEIARRTAAETIAGYMDKVLVVTVESRQQSKKQLARLMREAGRKGNAPAFGLEVCRQSCWLFGRQRIIDHMARVLFISLVFLHSRRQG
jgi:hypothetical protein